nr:integrase, catalytic region, zinc finger, CCHC-type, peptidase aspartic, catalytic [Tanacetum cinerariifolium]
MILEFVQNGPLIWPTIEENGVTRLRKYSELTPTEANQADCDVNATNIILQVNLQPQRDEFSQLDLGLTVLVNKQGDDPINAINHMMSFFSAVVTSRYPTTNNQLRNSTTTLGKKATINDGRVTLQPVQGRQISFAIGTTRTYIPGASRSLGFQNPFYLKKAQQLEPNVIKSTSAIVILNFEENLMLAEESRSKMLLKQQDPMVLEKKVNTTPVDYAAMDQHRLESKTFEIKMNQVLNENERLLKQVINKNIVNIVVNSSVNNASVNVHECKKCLKLETKSQEKDTVITKLKDRSKSLNGNVNKDKVKKDIDEIETINNELDHRVSKLIAENKHLKQTYKQLYDSIKPIRLIIATLRNELRNLKGKALIDNAVTTHTIAPEMLKIDMEPLVVQIVLWYLDFGCSKHMTGYFSQLTNFINKFLGNVKFGNDHVAKIMGYGDYHIRNVTISRVYYVEGLGHNLFFVRQFCDSKLEVAFHQHTCFIRNLEGVDLLTGSRGNNLYTLSLRDMMATDNGTEYVNQPLREYYEKVGITHETFVARSPQQNGVIERYVPHMNNDPFFSILIPENVSDTSSLEVIPTIVHTVAPNSEHVNKWTKDHPLDNIIGELERPVSTRLQLYEQALFCYHDAFLSSVKPKTYKDALNQACWIKAMQEELNEFEHLKVWELVPRPDKVMVITLKLIYNVKLDELVYHNVYSPPSSIPQMEYAPRANQQPEFTQLDSGLTVPVFKQGDDPIDAINHMMSFLSDVVTSHYPTTNNQLRNSSNLRQQATINDERVTLQPVQGRKISFATSTTGTYTPRTSGSNYRKQRTFMDKVLSVQAQANGKILHEEELAFWTDPGITEEQLKTQVINCTKINLDNKSVNDTLIAELERYTEQVKVLKEGQNVKVKSQENFLDSHEQNAEINRLKQTLSEQLLFSKMKIVTVLQNDFKKEESRNIDKEVALEKKIRLLDNIVYKRDQSAQAVYILTNQSLKEELSKLKGKALVDNAVTSHTIASEMLKIDMEPLAPILLNNRTVHSDYLRLTQEQAAILKEVMEQGKSQNPLNNSLDHACLKLSTSASRSQPSCNTKNDKIQQPPSSTQKNKVEAQPRTVKSSLKNKNYV